MLMQRLLTKLFTSDASLLVISGVAAQVINLAAYPLLTQSYSPADFGAFSVITALANFSGAAILLRFDAIIQIVDPKEEKEILSAAVATGFGLALACIALILVLGEWMLALLGADMDWHAGYALVLPVLALMNGLFALSRQYFAKTQRYRRFSSANFLRTLTMVTAQLSLVVVLPGPAGLIAGFALGLAMALVLAWPVPIALLTRVAATPLIALRRARATILQHRTFIRVDVVNVLIASSIFSIYPVIVLIGFGAEEAGIFAIASRLVFIPVDVLAGSISTVYFHQFSLAVRRDEGMIQMFVVTFAWASTTAAAIVVIVLLAADPFVRLFFPPEWAQASNLMLFLLPTFVARFIVSCLGSTPLALSRPRILLGWNLAQIAIISLTWIATIDQSLELFLLVGGSGLLTAGALYVGTLWVLIRKHTG